MKNHLCPGINDRTPEKKRRRTYEKENIKKNTGVPYDSYDAVSATGCGGSGGDSKEEKKPTKTAEDTNWEGAEKAADLSGKVTYMHSGDDYEREMYANVFSTYEQYAPNVEVEQMYVPSDYDTKLQTLAVADDLPDLFWVGESGVKSIRMQECSQSWTA